MQNNQGDEETSMMIKKEVKRIALGSIVAVISTTVIFSGASLGVKALEVSKNQVVKTNYNIFDNGSTNGKVPLDYERQDYEVKLIGKNQPSENDMKIEEAAELASQNLWRTFRVNLSGQTIEMNYEPASKVQPRATWGATVKINENLSYDFMLDAITGESYWIEKRAYHQADISEGLNKELLQNHEEYQQIVKELVEKYQLLPTKIKAIDYISQGYDRNEINNKNANITFQVTSEDDKKIQLMISTYNKELLSIGYDGWLEEAERLEQRLEKNLHNDAIPLNITDELVKEVEETNTPIIINE